MASSRKPIRIVIAIAILLCGSGIVWLAHQVQVNRTDTAEIRQYKQEHSSDRIVGKTPDEVVAMFGEPHLQQRDAGGKTTLMTYRESTRGLRCEIVFLNGVATRVSFHAQ